LGTATKETGGYPDVKKKTGFRTGRQDRKIAEIESQMRKRKKRDQSNGGGEKGDTLQEKAVTHRDSEIIVVTPQISWMD